MKREFIAKFISIFLCLNILFTSMAPFAYAAVDWGGGGGGWEAPADEEEPPPAATEPAEEPIEPTPEPWTPDPADVPIVEPAPECNRDCSNSWQVCSGESFDDGCGGVCFGSSDCSVPQPAPECSWRQLSSTKYCISCNEASVTESDGCGNTRNITVNDSSCSGDSSVCSSSPIIPSGETPGSCVCNSDDRWEGSGCEDPGGICRLPSSNPDVSQAPGSLDCQDNCNQRLDVCEGLEFYDSCGHSCQGALNCTTPIPTPEPKTCECENNYFEGNDCGEFLHTFCGPSPTPVSTCGDHMVGDAWQGACTIDGQRTMLRCDPGGGVSSSQIEDPLCAPSPTPAFIPTPSPVDYQGRDWDVEGRDAAASYYAGSIGVSYSDQSCQERVIDSCYRTVCDQNLHKNVCRQIVESQSEYGGCSIKYDQPGAATDEDCGLTLGASCQQTRINEYDHQECDYNSGTLIWIEAWQDEECNQYKKPGASAGGSCLSDAGITSFYNKVLSFAKSKLPQSSIYSEEEWAKEIAEAAKNSALDDEAFRKMVEDAFNLEGEERDKALASLLMGQKVSTPTCDGVHKKGETWEGACTVDGQRTYLKCEQDGSISANRVEDINCLPFLTPTVVPYDTSLIGQACTVPRGDCYSAGAYCYGTWWENESKSDLECSVKSCDSQCPLSLFSANGTRPTLPENAEKLRSQAGVGDRQRILGAGESIENLNKQIDECNNWDVTRDALQRCADLADVDLEAKELADLKRDLEQFPDCKDVKEGGVCELNPQQEEARKKYISDLKQRQFKTEEAKKTFRDIITMGVSGIVEDISDYSQLNSEAKDQFEKSGLNDRKNTGKNAQPRLDPNDPQTQQLWHDTCVVRHDEPEKCVQILNQMGEGMSSPYDDLDEDIRQNPNCSSEIRQNNPGDCSLTLEQEKARAEYAQKLAERDSKFDSLFLKTAMFVGGFASLPGGGVLKSVVGKAVSKVTGKVAEKLGETAVEKAMVQAAEDAIVKVSQAEKEAAFSSLRRRVEQYQTELLDPVKRAQLVSEGKFTTEEAEALIVQVGGETRIVRTETGLRQVAQEQLEQERALAAVQLVKAEAEKKAAEAAVAARAARDAKSVGRATQKFDEEEAKKAEAVVEPKKSDAEPAKPKPDPDKSEPAKPAEIVEPQPAPAKVPETPIQPEPVNPIVQAVDTAKDAVDDVVSTVGKVDDAVRDIVDDVAAKIDDIFSGGAKKKVEPESKVVEFPKKEAPKESDLKIAATGAPLPEPGEVKPDKPGAAVQPVQPQSSGIIGTAQKAVDDIRDAIGGIFGKKAAPVKTGEAIPSQIKSLKNIDSSSLTPEMLVSHADPKFQINGIVDGAKELERAYPDATFKVFSTEGSSAVLFESVNDSGVVYKVYRVSTKDAFEYSLAEVNKIRALSEDGFAPKLIEFRGKGQAGKPIVVMEKVEFDQGGLRALTAEQREAEIKRAAEILRKSNLYPNDIELAVNKKTGHLISVDSGGFSQLNPSQAGSLEKAVRDNIEGFIKTDVIEGELARGGNPVSAALKIKKELESLGIKDSRIDRTIKNNYIGGSQEKFGFPFNKDPDAKLFDLANKASSGTTDVELKAAADQLVSSGYATRDAVEEAVNAGRSARTSFDAPPKTVPEAPKPSIAVLPKPNEVNPQTSVKIQGMEFYEYGDTVAREWIRLTRRHPDSYGPAILKKLEPHLPPEAKSQLTENLSVTERANIIAANLDKVSKDELTKIAKESLDETVLDTISYSPSDFLKLRPNTDLAEAIPNIHGLEKVSAVLHEDGEEVFFVQVKGKQFVARVKNSPLSEAEIKQNLQTLSDIVPLTEVIPVKESSGKFIMLTQKVEVGVGEVTDKEVINLAIKAGDAGFVPELNAGNLMKDGSGKVWYVDQDVLDRAVANKALVTSPEIKSEVEDEIKRFADSQRVLKIEEVRPQSELKLAATGIPLPEVLINPDEARKAIENGVQQNPYHLGGFDQQIDTLRKSYLDTVSALEKAGKLTEQANADLLEIASKMSLKGKEITRNPSPLKYSAQRIAAKAKKLMEVYKENPALAEEITSREIVGGHGSNSGSLLGVLDIGLRPQKELEERGLIIGGEGLGSAGGSAEVVSFAYWEADSVLKQYSGSQGRITVEILNKRLKDLKNMTAKESEGIRKETLKIIEKHTQEMKDYLLSHPSGDLQADLIKENFPVIYLTKGRNLSFDNAEVPYIGLSDEFIVHGGLGVEDVSIILVPKEKVGFVQNLVKEKGRDIKVYAREDWFAASTDAIPGKIKILSPEETGIKIPSKGITAQIGDTAKNAWDSTFGKMFGRKSSVPEKSAIEPRPQSDLPVPTGLPLPVLQLPSVVSAPKTQTIGQTINGLVDNVTSTVGKIIDSIRNPFRGAEAPKAASKKPLQNVVRDVKDVLSGDIKQPMMLADKGGLSFADEFMEDAEAFEAAELAQLKVKVVPQAQALIDYLKENKPLIGKGIRPPKPDAPDEIKKAWYALMYEGSTPATYSNIDNLLPQAIDTLATHEQNFQSILNPLQRTRKIMTTFLQKAKSRGIDISKVNLDKVLDPGQIHILPHNLFSKAYGSETKGEVAGFFAPRSKQIFIDEAYKGYAQVCVHECWHKVGDSINPKENNFLVNRLGQKGSIVLDEGVNEYTAQTAFSLAGEKAEDVAYQEQVDGVKNIIIPTIMGRNNMTFTQAENFVLDAGTNGNWRSLFDAVGGDKNMKELVKKIPVPANSNVKLDFITPQRVKIAIGAILAVGAGAEYLILTTENTEPKTEVNVIPVSPQVTPLPTKPALTNGVKVLPASPLPTKPAPINGVIILSPPTSTPVPTVAPTFAPTSTIAPTWTPVPKKINLKLVEDVYAEDKADNISKLFDADYFEKAIKQELIKMDFEEYGQISPEVIENILSTDVLPSSITEYPSGYILTTGKNGIVEGEIERNEYGVKIDSLPGVDIKVPEEINTTKGQAIIPIAIKKGSGKVTQMPIDFSASVSSFSGNTAKVSLMLFSDDNDNGKMDKNEKILPWAGFNVGLTKVLQEKNIALLSGWNLINLVNKPTRPMKASDLLGEIAAQGGYATTVSTLSDGAWESFVARGDKTFSNDDFPIEPGKAYFVKALKKSNLSFKGRNFDAPVKLNFNSGWNAVAMPKTSKEYKASTLIDEINAKEADDADSMTRFSSGLWDTFVKKKEEKYGNDFMVEYNKGYLLRLEKPMEFTP